MKVKEECGWCMSTQHIERKIANNMPEEFKYRCSACHEQWSDIHYECDVCSRIINSDEEMINYINENDTYICSKCKDEHGHV